MTVDSISTENSSKIFQELAQTSLITGLRLARVQAGMSCREAANSLEVAAEVFDDIETGKMSLNLTEISKLLVLRTQLRI